jgi:DNA-binding NarL/FixJ family response regulator
MTAEIHILVIDDEPSALMTTEAQLAPEGWTVQSISDPRLAIERLAQPPASVVLCDAMMPGIDGFTLCRQFKASLTWSRTPFIMLTALNLDEHIVSGLEAGADHFVTKPVAGPVLRARVRAALRARLNYQVAESNERRDAVITAAGLTAREREVLEMLLLGRTHDDIAVALDISERTSRYHQTNLFSKLGAESRLDLMRILG